MDTADALQRLVVGDDREGAERQLGGVGFQSLLLELCRMFQRPTGIQQGFRQFQQVSRLQCD